MAGIASGLTFDLPNYVGDLFSISPQDTPFVSAIGGLTGGERAKSTKFGWQFYDLRPADDSRQKKEGQDAVVGQNRVRSNIENVVEIHQEAIEVSYTKQAAVNLTQNGGEVEGSNPVTDEFAWQVDRQLEQIALDVEASFLTGSFSDPADNTTARATRGLLEAVDSNVVVADGGSGAPDDLSLELLGDMLQLAYDNGGLSESASATLLLGSTQKRKLSAAATAAGLVMPSDRQVAGVNVSTIETDFGTLNVMLDRHLPDDVVVGVTLGECAPVLLEIPGKGFLFVEPLAQTGAKQSAQIYGEIGLKYGNQRKHGKVTNLTTS